MAGRSRQVASRHLWSLVPMLYRWGTYLKQKAGGVGALGVRGQTCGRPTPCLSLGPYTRSTSLTP